MRTSVSFRLQAVRLFLQASAPAVTALLLVAMLGTLGTAQNAQPQLARGVLTLVPAEVTEADTVSGPRVLPELLAAAEAWTPHYFPPSDTLYEIAQSITIRRPVWQFEFAAKPLRIVTADVNGQPQRVWYLLYRLRNLGGHLKPVSKDGGRSFELEEFDTPLRFFPRFVLRDHEHDKNYLDSVIPNVVEKIQRSEFRDPSIPLYDSISISTLRIPVSTEAVDNSVWGVATWTDFDRRADFISVYIQGLTNAYRWEDSAQGDRKYFFKTLQMNYWRAGDAVHEHSSEFRVGLPTFSDGPELDRCSKMYEMDQRDEFTWVYRP